MAGGAVWYPNTQMAELDGAPPPPRIVRARGMWLHDSRGRRMLDGVASMWCNVWGHSDQDMIGAITRQASRLQHTPLFNLTHGPAEDLARRLVDMSPGMHRVFYSDNGSSAVEVAIKMALQYWRNKGEPDRDRIAVLDGGYHGDTFGAMTAGSAGGFFDAFGANRAFGTVRIRVPADGGVQQCLERADAALGGGHVGGRGGTKGGGGVAALVMESGAQMAAGAVIYPRGFQSGMRRLCKKHGVLLVLDEIATGFGRLGTMAQYAVQGGAPDIAVYGKMMTGGYLTMAATLASRGVYKEFLGGFGDGVHLFHGHTYTGNPLAAAAAVENMRLYKRRRLIDRVSKTARVFAERAPGIADMDEVEDVRHCGMLMGIELKRGVGAGGRRVSTNRVIFEAGRRNGVYLRTLGGVVMLVPPLAMSAEEVGMLVDRTARTIRDVGAHPIRRRRRGMSRS